MGRGATGGGGWGAPTCLDEGDMGARLGVCGARASVSFALGREAEATRQRASPTSVSMCNVRERLRGIVTVGSPDRGIAEVARLCRPISTAESFASGVPGDPGKKSRDSLYCGKAVYGVKVTRKYLHTRKKKPETHGLCLF